MKMLPDFISEYSALFGTIRKVVPPSMKIYLVGGAVRDILLGRPIRDFDFTVEGLVRPIGKYIADTLNGAYYVLDDERDMVRVIIDDPDKGQFDIDIAQMTGDDITSDLKGRDFTINAIAIELADEPVLVDPLGGEADLRNKTLRMCDPFSLDNDPMRGLRAVRMCLEFGLLMDEELASAMEGIRDSLDDSSFERYRDELFKIIKIYRNQEAFSMAIRYGFIDYLFEGWNREYAKDHGRLITNTDLFIRLLTFSHGGLQSADAHQEMAVKSLGNYLGASTAFYDKTLALYHTRRMLTAFAAASEVFSGSHEELVKDWCIRLTFSGMETSFVQQAILSYRFLAALDDPDVFDDVAIYRYFRQYKEGGIAGALLYLADQYTICKEKTSKKDWQDRISLVEKLVEAFYTRNLDVIQPKPFLSGDVILQITGKPAGPFIGTLKNDLIEAQIRGEVSDREEAEQFVIKKAAENSIE